ncbi:TIGR04282 family arsenosugar biosynthesis glycosyltransferase [Umezawaea sp.]|uniref:TIGR04282 family arsenosugar biosynthesis glycosyltransferase n=1 Tax=Umezawaea sp. TaxID=1955258 RepID=UPI002ED54F49
MSARATVLVVAKAPVPGLAKTRLSPAVPPAQAADIAAASLLDTLDAVLATPGVVPVVALTGDLTKAERSREIRSLLRHVVLLPQRGADFPARLANAHADAARLNAGLPVLQIGMDTPQVTAELLDECVGSLRYADGVLGPATDGGWWALGLRDGHRADVLRTVPTSRDDTGALTAAALERSGLRIGLLPELSDVDDMTTAREVAAVLPGSRFAEALLVGVFR